MVQITVRIPRELLTQFQKTVSKGGDKRWGAQKKAIEEAMKLWLYYKGGVFVALVNNKVKTFDEIKDIINSGKEFNILPLEGKWSIEEKEALKDVVVKFLKNGIPEKIFVGESEANIDDIKKNRDAPVFCVWGDKPDPVLERSFGKYLRKPDKQLIFSNTELSLEINT